MYKLLTTNGRAKRGILHTPHGQIHTPVFMNVATAGAIKGGLSAADLEELGCTAALANTYHLHLRPGDGLVKNQGGIREFMDWQKPLLTDSGGFQVFSLAALRKITEEGVNFSSHIDGRKIFMGPEESMAIQSNLASTIAMAFDECPPYPAERGYMRDSIARTTRWLKRSRAKLAELNAAPETLNPAQMLFGINQGGVYADLRIEHAREIRELDLPGYAIGGLAVGEPHSEMYRILEEVVPHLPQDKPTYLMGVGTPQNLLESVARGVDFFDCVLPARNGRHGHVYTSAGKLNMKNAVHADDNSPIDQNCDCPVCRRFSRAYIRHLFKAGEILAMRLAVMHNLFFYNRLMADVRLALEEGRFEKFRTDRLASWRQTG